jgi:branched-subunit amino acid transport protein
MKNLIPVIFAMAAVTYIPRLLPFVILDGKHISGRIDMFLRCIPAAAIGALIIPGVFESIPQMPLAVVPGMVFTAVFGLWRGGIIIPVTGAVFITYCVLLYAG